MEEVGAAKQYETMDEDESMPSSDDDEDDGQDEADQKRLGTKIAQLTKAVKDNPYDYPSHLDLIDSLGKAGELEQLRGARETFASNYPLTPHIWLSWIGDEQRLATSEEEKKAVADLMDRAVQDYLSVELWLEYCQFSLSNIGTPEGMAKAREIFERAVIAAGVHTSRGSLIWEAYREFESVLTSMQPQNEEQIARIDKLFCRQLAVPLISMDATYREYQEWLETNGKSIDPNVERNFKTASAMLQSRMKFEDRLTSDSDNDSNFECYAEYINLERKEGNPVRIQNLYERRATDHCLNPIVWLEYADYLENTLKIIHSAAPIYERAVRNCSWSVQLWLKLIRCCERQNVDVLKNVERALTSGLTLPTDYREIWLAYIDYERRNLPDDDDDADEEEEKGDNEGTKKEWAKMRATFGRALEQLTSIAGDPECKVARYWASIEADRFHSMDEARKIWSEIVSGPAGDNSQFWMEFITLEKIYGDTKHLRRLLPRALDRTKDWPEGIGEAWIQFEREEGTLDSLEEAEKKYAARMQVAAKLRANTEEESQAKIEKRKQRDTDKRRDKRHQDSEGRKRKANNVVNEEEPAFKKPMIPTAAAASKGTTSPVKAPPGFKVAPTPMGFKVAPPPGFKEPATTTKEEEVAPPPGFQPQEKKVVGKDECTMFLSNLAFGLTEDQVKAVMGTSGEVVEVRLIKNYAGKSKGFGFVEFKSVQAARHALGRDHELLDGRPIYISECDPEKKKKGHQFKYSTELEKQKLFVKGLSKSASEETVRLMFEAFGEVKNVRLVTFRNGHSKGIAYVEFRDEGSAARAIVKLDDSEVNGSKLSISISNPPARKDTPATLNVSLSQSLGGAGSTLAAAAGPRGRGRSQVSFVPRALMKNAVSTTYGSAGGANGAPIKKTNDEFRNMLLGQPK
jgi:RNA recognition motif-containing protein